MEFGNNEIVVGGAVLCANRDGSLAKADTTRLEIGEMSPEYNKFLEDIKNVRNIDGYIKCLDVLREELRTKGEFVDNQYDIQGEIAIISEKGFGTMIFMRDGVIDERDVVLDSEQIQAIKDNARDIEEAKEVIANMRGNEDKTHNSLSEKEYGGNEINDKSNERMQGQIIETEKATRGSAYLNRNKDDGRDGPG